MLTLKASPFSRCTSKRPLFVAVNNIPTPYRVHLFEALDEAFSAHGVDFEAWFMAKSESGRYWTMDPSEWRMKSRIFHGLHPQFRGLTLHLNPAILAQTYYRRPRWMLLGGSWITPTTALLSATSRLIGRGTRPLIWSEANYATTTNPSGVIAALRAAIYRRCDACVIPGRIAEDTIRNIWGIRNIPTIDLPNIVDERVYRKSGSIGRIDRASFRMRLGIGANKIAVLIIARLHERSKGILNFLDAVEPLLADRLVVVLAGEGPDRGAIEAWIARRPTASVALLGHVEQSDILQALAGCDAFALPSFMDPNPLAVIEALWAGMPLLVSRNCGNWPETVRHGTNGWVIDPSDAHSIRHAVSELVSASPEQLRNMGDASILIAEERFETTSIARRFAEQVMEVH